MKYLIAAFFFLCATATWGQTTYNAAGCSLSQVQSAYTTEQASKVDGDIIAIPSCGSTNWGSLWSISPTNSLTFQFNGTVTGTCNPYNLTCTATDNSIINDTVSSGSGPMWAVTTAANKSFRITGMKLTGGSSSTCGGSIVIAGNSTAVRLDHNHFASTSDCKYIQIAGCVYGVGDHNIIDMTAASVNNFAFLNQNGCGGDPLNVGNGQWNEATNPGTAQSFYWENNLFNGGTNTGGSGKTVAPFADDCSGGGRWVFRFNIFKGVRLQSHAIGHSNNPPDRSCRAQEAYANIWNGTSVTNSTNPNESAMFITGGTLYSFENNVTESMKNFIEEFVDRTSNATYGQTAPPSGWGYCGTAQTGSSSAWDQNQNSTGKRCLDGVGVGVGDLLSGSFPNVCNITLNPSCNTFTGQWPRQALEPVYEALDAFTTAPGWGGVLFSNGDTATVQNEEWYVSSNQGSGSNCTGFTGASGVGCGARASRPATCTTGVGYYSTDQGTWNTSGSGPEGVLDICTSTNTWTNASYTPYTYPHPLVTGGTKVATPTFSPLAGGFASSQTVTISTSTAGATICYRTDGGTPAESGNICTAPALTYSAPITVSTSETVTAIGTLAGSTDSAVATAIYFIGTAPASSMFAGYVGNLSGSQGVIR